MKKLDKNNITHMNYYVGIDLGTTNSSIALFDGENVTLFKNSELNDVTPSALVIDKRGNKYIGKRAYDLAPIYYNSSALLFKRLMGSNTKIIFSTINEEKTPEECSAEILKALYQYIPETIRKEILGTVITVPASFNQMQKEATIKAANLAELGNIALMQEPVAAVISIINKKNIDGYFLVYDLGGGTLDIAIAECNKGNVSLIANGGIQICGGRDIDRAIEDNIVYPWLKKNFKLPPDFEILKKYQKLIKLANLAVERAKIELSSKEETKIILNELEVSVEDESNQEIFIEIKLTRNDIYQYIKEIAEESFVAINEVLHKASLSTQDINNIIFIGGPTNYKPLRDLICKKTSIVGISDINPMTAVAEGASIYAESIDWQSINKEKKSNKGKITSLFGSLPVSFVYISRTANKQARLIVKVDDNLINNHKLQIKSLDFDWSTDLLPLKNGAILFLELNKNGLNKFEVTVYDKDGNKLDIASKFISITKVTTIIDAITASHSIGIAVKSENSYSTEIEWLVRTGDSLPKKGIKKFKSLESLSNDSKGSINFKLFEGEITDNIFDNRNIGTLKIKGSDFYGCINAGDEIICEYEVLDSGNIKLKVTIPSIGASIDSNKNFYSPQEGQLNFNIISEKIKSDIDNISNRLSEFREKHILDDDLVLVQKKIYRAKELINSFSNIEKNLEANERILEAKKLLAKIRKSHIKEIRLIDLNLVSDFYDEKVRQYSRKSEFDAFEVLKRTAYNDLDRTTSDFESTLEEMKYLNFIILNRQDSFVINRFKQASNSSYNYSDQLKYNKLIKDGQTYLQNNDISSLREIMSELTKIKINDDYELALIDDVNIRKS